MSFIDHNCVCGHPVIMHAPREHAGVVCHCGCVDDQAAESVVISTFTLDGMVTPIVAPGHVVPLPPPRHIGCKCESCVALYEEVSA